MVKKSGGCPSKLSNRSKWQSLRAATVIDASSSSITSSLQLPMCSRTVRNVLQASENQKYVKMKGKNRLLRRHIDARWEFSKKHIGNKDFWNHVIFSDEKKFNLDGTDGLNYYWHDLRMESKLLSRWVQGGGSVIWATFSGNAKSAVAFVKAYCTADNYQDILGNYLLPLRDELNDPELLF